MVTVKHANTQKGIIIIIIIIIILKSLEGFSTPTHHTTLARGI